MFIRKILISLLISIGCINATLPVLASDFCERALDKQYYEILREDTKVSAIGLTIPQNKKINELLGVAFMPMILHLEKAIQESEGDLKTVAAKIRKESRIINPIPYFWRVRNELLKYYYDNRSIRFEIENEKFFSFLETTQSKIDQDFDRFLESREQNETVIKLLYPMIGKEAADQMHKIYQNTIQVDAEIKMNLNTIKNFNPGKLHREFNTKQFEQLMFSVESSKYLSTIERYFKIVQLPVTAYGENYTRRLIETSRVLNQLIEDHLIEAGVQLMKSGPELISKQTARGRNDKFQKQNLSPPVRAMMEGVMTVAQTIILLSAEKVGDLTEDQLIEAIVMPKPGKSNGLVQEFTNMVRMDGVGPLFFRGFYYANPLTISDSGQVSLSKNLRSTLIDQMKKAYEQNVKSEEREHSVGLGCPVAKLKDDSCRTGIQIMAEAFLSAYKSLEK